VSALSSLKLVSLAGSGHHITSLKIDLVSYRQYNITVFTVLSMPYAKILTTVDIGRWALPLARLRLRYHTGRGGDKGSRKPYPSFLWQSPPILGIASTLFSFSGRRSLPILLLLLFPLNLLVDCLLNPLTQRLPFTQGFYSSSAKSIWLSNGL